MAGAEEKNRSRQFDHPPDDARNRARLDHSRQREICDDRLLGNAKTERQKRSAQNIKADQQKIQAIIEEKANIDADLSYRLGLYFGFREDYWLDLQKHYELECWKDELEEKVKKQIHPYQPTLNA